MDGPTKGLQTITLLSQDARLKGRPKLCSDCGFCDSSMRPLMAQSCVFVENRTADIERHIHGRARQTPDELVCDRSRAQRFLHCQTRRWRDRVNFTTTWFDTDKERARSEGRSVDGGAQGGRHAAAVEEGLRQG